MTVSHFELLGLPRTMNVDIAALEQRQRTLALEWHPDRVKSDDPRERLKAAEKTAQLNEAVRALRDPVRRAFYVLELAGVDLLSESGNTFKSVPADFLEVVLERREALDEAKKAANQAEIEKLGAEADTALKAALVEGTRALDTWLSSASPDAVEAASKALSRVRYFQRFREDIDAYFEGQDA